MIMFDSLMPTVLVVETHRRNSVSKWSSAVASLARGIGGHCHGSQALGHGSNFMPFGTMKGATILA